MEEYLSQLTGCFSVGNVSMEVDDVCNSTRHFADAFEFDLAEFDVLRRPAYAAVTIAVYAVVLTCGVLGNGLVVVTVVTTPRMRTATNIFIANLAVADIFVCAFDLPLNLHYQLTDDWAFGPILCRIIPAVFGVVVYASTLTLTAIAADRFALIVIGVRKRMSVRVAIGFVCVIAALSVIVALPLAIFSRLVTVAIPFVKSRRMCRESWPSRRIRNVYTIATLIFQFVLPLTLIGILYLLVFRHVRASRRQAGSRRRMSKTNRMLAAVVLVFAVAWTPYQIYSVLSEFQPAVVSGPYFTFVDLMLRVVAMGSSGINPFLYGWMNSNFRAAFLAIVRRQKLPSNRQTMTDGDGLGTPLTERHMMRMRTNVMIEESRFDGTTIS